MPALLYTERLMRIQKKTENSSKQTIKCFLNGELSTRMISLLKNTRTGTLYL